MKRTIAGISAFFLLAGNAMADDQMLAACQAYEEEFDTDVECECLVEAIVADPSLAEEFQKIASPDDVENASERVKETIAACEPE